MMAVSASPVPLLVGFKVVPSFSRWELFLSHVTEDGQPFVAAIIQLPDPALDLTTTIHPGG